MAERIRPNSGNFGYHQQAETVVGKSFSGLTAIDPRQEALRLLPLHFLPDRKNRTENSNPYLHPAGHEAGHLLTAMSLGYSGDVSFEPDNHSLARVTLHGSVPVEDLKIIAAAGMVDTPFGNAMGFSSDKFKIHLMRLIYGGKDVNQSQAAAEAALNSFGPVRERFSEILAYYAAHVNPVISADVISQIYQRALGELAWEKKISGRQVENQVSVKPHANDMKTVISEHKGYVTVTKLKRSDKIEIVETYRICSHCLGINQHYPDCQVYKKEADGTKEKWPHPIFDWEQRIKQLADPALGLIGQAIGQVQMNHYFIAEKSLYEAG